LQIEDCKLKIDGPRPGLKFAICIFQFAICNFLISGCGYHAGDLYDTSIQTIAVPIFENRTFYRDVEFRLTEALTKQIESRTPYKVAEESSADTILTGTITRVDKRLLSRQFNTGLPQEVQVVVTASLEWKDLRTGRILRKRGRIEAAGEYIPTRPVAEPFEAARHAAIDRLAHEIVAVMRQDW
jgi:hypothetical protein